MVRFLLAGCKDRRIAHRTESRGERDQRHRNARKRENCNSRHRKPPIRTAFLPSLFEQLTRRS